MREFRCEAILFDCDGVLVDSDASVLNAWNRWAVDLGVDPAAVIAVMHGRRSTDTVTALVPAEKRPAALELINRYEIEDARAVTALPGVVELLASIPPDRWAVVTSGTLPLATARMSAAGLTLPNVFVTADDVVAGKPDPEGYRTAAARLGFDPVDTIVIEDAPFGVAAAHAAGAGAVVGVGDREGLEGDVTVRDLRQLRWAGDRLIVE